jgi:hypothetical protein
VTNYSALAMRNYHDVQACGNGGDEIKKKVEQRLLQA